MSFEHSTHQAQTKPAVETPSAAVQDEAGKIIARMDGSGPFANELFGNPEHDSARAQQVRDMLLKDSQTLSPKDMHDLILTVMNNENRKKGYDLDTFSHSSKDIQDKTDHINEERQNLGRLMANATNEERLSAFAEFNRTHNQELEAYKSERVLTLTHHSESGVDGERGRTPGANIEVAAYRNAGGLPDFHIVDKGDGK